MLDPELVNLLTFANTAQNRQLSQQQVQLLNKLLAEAEREAKKPKCPACGGALEVSFRKCKHCATDLSWIDGHPCEPGQEETLKANLRKIREHKREEQARKARHGWLLLAQTPTYLVCFSSEFGTSGSAARYNSRRGSGLQRPFRAKT